MPDRPPAWVDVAPLGAARWRLACITRRGVGMTLAAAVFWAARAGVARFAGLDPARLGLFSAIGAALVYPGGYLLNRALGGDLIARGSDFRGVVGAITVGQLLGGPLIVALLVMEVRLVAFALAATIGAHFLPYGWLYRAPAYYVLGIAGAAIGAALQALAPSQANVTIPASMAVLYALCGAATWRRNRREGAC